jgi:lysophospholipid acyltransferase (LPLAT)-like uncharacterized protein
MKRLGKRLLSFPLAVWVLALLASLYIRLVHVTSRIEILGRFPEAGYAGESYILTFWHGRLLMMPMMARRFTGGNRKRTIYVMISLHRDGAFIARTMEWFGFSAVRGSGRRGGTEVARAARRVLQAGDHVAITPDGPKGPANRVQKGATVLARLTGAPILPVSFAAAPAKRFRSWDRFLLALPFGRVAVAVGEPLVYRAGSTETFRLSLEESLNRLTEQAEAALR